MENEFNTIEIANNIIQSNEFNSVPIKNEIKSDTDQFNTISTHSEYTHPKPKQKLKIPIYQLISTFVVFVVATVSVINVAYPEFLPAALMMPTATETEYVPTSQFNAINYSYDYSTGYPEIKFTFDYDDKLGYWSDYMLVIYTNDISHHAWNGIYLTQLDLDNGKVILGYGGSTGPYAFAVYAATTDPKYEGATIFTFTTNASEGEPTENDLVLFKGYDSTPRALLCMLNVNLIGG